MLLILFFILLLNIVAIALTYYCLSNREQKEKVLFIAIGVAVIYILTSIVYWISTKNVEIKEVSQMGKNLITFLFVPINGIIVLPILAKSYTKYKSNKLELDKLKNRGLVLAMLLAILLILEYVYFKDIQNSIVAIIEENIQVQQKEQEKYNLTNYIKSEQAQDALNSLSNTQANDISNTQANEMAQNMMSNNVNVNQNSTNNVNVISNDL